MRGPKLFGYLRHLDRLFLVFTSLLSILVLFPGCAETNSPKTKAKQNIQVMGLWYILDIPAIKIQNIHTQNKIITL